RLGHLAVRHGRPRLRPVGGAGRLPGARRPRRRGPPALRPAGAGAVALGHAVRRPRRVAPQHLHATVPGPARRPVAGAVSVVYSLRERTTLPNGWKLAGRALHW